MIDKINDIKRAVEAEAYLSALALALTIPDVCGKLVDPKKKVKERYVDWFNNYAFQFYNLCKCKQEYPQFTGEICYKLRCAFLHAGNTEGIPIDQFELCIDGCSGYGLIWSDENDKKQRIRINVKELCLALCNAAEQFCIATKLDLSDAHIKIINI